ncbi:MAG: GIY-YIG nuclease family protein [bacterium]|nr:GIY-YIG nuclease family protein [bacterium]
MKMMYVYILECSDNSLYTGVTNDIDRRVEEHQNGSNKEAYTYSRRPVKPVYSEFFTNPTDAINFEKQIKGWNRKKKIAIIKGDFKELVK